MYRIVEAGEKHTKELTNFQIKMAMETEKLELNEELVHKAIDFLAKNRKYGLFYVSEFSETD